MDVDVLTATQHPAERERLPDGVVVKALAPHHDPRGIFTEMFRLEWDLGQAPMQWNALRSKPNVLRGVHVHRIHVDYLTTATGETFLGLHDLRAASPSRGLSTILHVTADNPRLVVIPPGVAHGFYFPVDSCLVLGTTHYFDPADDIGCRWNDPALGLDWPCDRPILSSRDATAGSLAEMAAAYDA